MSLLVGWLCCAVWCGAGADGEASAMFRSRNTYDVQSTLVLSSLGARRDVGWRLEGTLALETQASDDTEDASLLRFTLQDVEVVSRGAHALAEWQRRGPAWRGAVEPFYAVRRAGRLAAAYLDPTDPPDVLNYKRALLSLFQFQLVDGEYNETDVSGECDVTYETISPTVFRKTKRRCAFEAAGRVRARRVSRYTLSAARDALASLHAEELLYLSLEPEPEAPAPPGEEPLGLKARSWHALTLRQHEQAPPATPTLHAALHALPPHLQDTPLPLPLPDEGEGEGEQDAENVEEAVLSHMAALRGWEAGTGGTREQAAALQPLLRAVRAAPAPALRALTQRQDMQDLLPGLCRVLGLAGTRGAWAAARTLLAPGATDALVALTQHYLAGLALAPRAHEDVVADVLALAEDAKLAAVAEAALLAGASAARGVGEDAGLAARDRLARALARCRDVSCRARHLRALGNMQRVDTAALLVAAAERGPALEAEAALGALRGLPSRALTPAQLERTALVAGNASGPLPVRALALELTVERACSRERRTVPLVVVRLAEALKAQRGVAAHELRRVLWQRLATLEDRVAVRALRRLLPKALRSWDARAHGGTSHVLARALDWRGGAWRGALHSAQLAARALLLRGRVALLADQPDGDQDELLAVEVWTRGMEAIAGGGAAGDEEEEEGGPAAGLQIAVRGVALPPLTLFEGQAELLGHIWSGAGSAPTGVARALVPLATWTTRAPLQAGCVLAGEAAAGAALALDAHGAVSLWHRTASARLTLRAAGAAYAAAGVVTAWGSLRARAEDAAQARLRIAPDLDFYEAVALCVRTDLDPHHLLRTVELQSVVGARSWRVRRNSTARVARAGRSLALTRDNDAECRAHTPLDENDPL